MKQILFILMFVGVLTSCQDYQNDKQQQTIDKRIDNELAKGERNDTIFLGLQFGMTEDEVYSYLRKLEKENKIYLNKLNIYEYKFAFGEKSILKKAYATFSADYFEDKLYKLSISVKSDEIIANSQIIQLRLVKLYGSKYGYSFLEEESALGDGKNYIWINGNRMIELVAGIDDARIFYTDLIAKQAKDEFEEAETIEQKEIIKDDI